jgi:glycosyltransferase involved in cell wall biosynthesis
MEAAAMGVPAVVTDVKGNREAVEQGRSGLLVPLADVPALAAAMERMLTEPGLAASMGQEARCIAAARFDEERVFSTVKAEYQALLCRMQCSPPVDLEKTKTQS